MTVGCRVLLIGDHWPTDVAGGLPRYMAELTTALAAKGVIARALVSGPAFDAPAGVVAGGSDGMSLPSRMARTWWASRRVTNDVDLLDVHFAPYALLPLYVGAGRRRRVVVHFHGPWAEEGRVAGSSRFSCFSKRMIERLVYRKAIRLITESEAFADVASTKYGIERRRIVVRRPAVDLDTFSPGDPVAARAQLGLPAGVPIVLCVRRLVDRMGIDVLLKAWADVRCAVTEAQLVIVGTGPRRRRLEEQADDLGVGPSVSFLGAVSPADLVAAYRAADVSVVPSTALEGFGLVVLESLACGTPVIGTDVGGLAEAVGAFDPHLVVPAGDVAALAAGLVA